MSRIVEMRDTIKATMKAKIEDRVTVITHGGTLDIEQIRRYAVDAPAIVIACIAFPSIEVQGSPVIAKPRWIAIVITRNEKMDDRDAAALALVELLLRLLAEQRWGLDYAQPTTGVNAANLYSTAVDAKGLALWAITWDQGYDLPGTFADALNDFETLYTKWDLDTSDGIDTDAEDLLTLPT